jgi:hypothetical protein
MRSVFAAILLCACAVIGSGTRSAYGVVIAYDGFDYPTGTIQGQGTPGQGFAAPSAGLWAITDVTSGSVNVTSPGLTYSKDGLDLETIGNNARPIRGSTSSNTGRAFRVLDGVETGANRTVWVSFLIQYPGPTPSITAGHGGVSLYSGSGTETLFLGKAGGSSTTWGFDRISPGGEVSTGVGITSAPAFLLTKLDFGATNVNVSMWVNPTLTDELLLGPAQASSSRTNFNFDRLRISTSMQTTGIIVDEVRVGDTYRDVTPVPEPGFISLAAAPLLLLRRRSRN